MIIRGDSQTIVRRLKSWQMKNPNLNPFVERSCDSSLLGHSQASTTAWSARSSPTELPGDVVYSSLKPQVSKMAPASYIAALSDVLSLTDEELGLFKSAGQWSPNQHCASILCAVCEAHYVELVPFRHLTV